MASLEDKSAPSGTDDERTRRDALARNLAARICDEHRTIEELDRVHRALSYIEQCQDIVEFLGRMQYALEGRGLEYRLGWNDALKNVMREIEARR